MASFGWLHLTDLHIGGDHRLWYGVREMVFDDLGRLHRICGPWDIVLFSGDLVYSGQEFDELDGFVAEFLQWLSRVPNAIEPAIVAVPGNHDLKRPRSNDAVAALLSEYYSKEEVRQWFWDETSGYRDTVVQAFSNYTSWWQRRCPRQSSFHDGILPGDFSFSLKKDGVSLGIVGLNTAFLQLRQGEYFGKLAVDVRQFNAACGGDGPRWTSERDANLLVTHHPPEWLDHNALHQLNSEIFPPQRFAAHLCGHMHRPLSQTIAVGGSSPRRVWRGCSLFGIETWDDAFGKKEERLHGYSAGRISLEGACSSIRQWPRKAHLRQAAYWGIDPDTEFVLEEDQGTIAEPLIRTKKPFLPPAPPQPPGPPPPFPTHLLLPRSTDPRLAKIKVLLDNSRHEVREGYANVGLTKDQVTHLADVLTSGMFANVRRSPEGRTALLDALARTYPRKEDFPIPEFQILKCPVTVDMFRLFAESRDYRTRAEIENQEITWKSVDLDARKNHPATFLTFGDALAFCSWVQDICHWKRVRLPTSLEYEYLVRGGNRDRLFPWGDRWEFDRCNDIFWGGDETTSPVDRFESGRTNPGDTWDLCGNVYEWLDDAAERGFRMVAGGSFKHAAIWCGHASARNRVAEFAASDEIGFRIVIKE